jgi:flavin-dependent dehydrogenase
MTDSDILPEGKQLLSIFWRRALNTTLHIRKLLPDSSIEFNLKVWPAGSDRSSGVAGEQWMAIGDAALAFDPLSSQGILHALISAERAVDCIARSNANRFDTEPYVTWTGRVLADYEKHRRWYYGLETRWPESVFWQRRQSGLLASSASAVSMVK